MNLSSQIFEKIKSDIHPNWNESGKIEMTFSGRVDNILFEFDCECSCDISQSRDEENNYTQETFSNISVEIFYFALVDALKNEVIEDITEISTELTKLIEKELEQ